MGVIGSGVQARHQIACLREVCAFRHVAAWSPSRARLDRYCQELRDSSGLAARAASGPEEVCQEADLVVTTTPAREPLICAEWLRSGQHVTAVGADSPGKQELDPRCFAR